MIFYANRFVSAQVGFSFGAQMISVNYDWKSERFERFASWITILGLVKLSLIYFFLFVDKTEISSRFLIGLPIAIKAFSTSVFVCKG